MTVKKYEKDGKIFWQVYVNYRSKKNPRVRIQKKLSGLESEREARSKERKLIFEASENITKEESKGLIWVEVNKSTRGIPSGLVPF